MLLLGAKNLKSKRLSRLKAHDFQLTKPRPLYNRQGKATWVVPSCDWRSWLILLESPLPLKYATNEGTRHFALYTYIQHNFSVWMGFMVPTNRYPLANNGWHCSLLVSRLQPTSITSKINQKQNENKNSKFFSPFIIGIRKIVFYHKVLTTVIMCMW